MSTDRTLSVDDAYALRCADCQIKFGLLQRRHHCRRCGEVFCAHCLATQIRASPHALSSSSSQSWSDRIARTVAYWTRSYRRTAALQDEDKKEGSSRSSSLHNDSGSGTHAVLHGCMYSTVKVCRRCASITAQRSLALGTRDLVRECSNSSNSTLCKSFTHGSVGAVGSSSSETTADACCSPGAEAHVTPRAAAQANCPDRSFCTSPCLCSQDDDAHATAAPSAVLTYAEARSGRDRVGLSGPRHSTRPIRITSLSPPRRGAAGWGRPDPGPRAFVASKAVSACHSWAAQTTHAVRDNSAGIQGAACDATTPRSRVLQVGALYDEGVSSSEAVLLGSHSSHIGDEQRRFASHVRRSPSSSWCAASRASCVSNWSPCAADAPLPVHRSRNKHTSSPAQSNTIAPQPSLVSARAPGLLMLRSLHTTVEESQWCGEARSCSIANTSLDALLDCVKDAVTGSAAVGSAANANRVTVNDIHSSKDKIIHGGVKNEGAETDVWTVACEMQLRNWVRCRLGSCTTTSPLNSTTTAAAGGGGQSTPHRSSAVHNSSGNPDCAHVHVAQRELWVHLISALAQRVIAHTAVPPGSHILRHVGVVYLPCHRYDGRLDHARQSRIREPMQRHIAHARSTMNNDQYAADEHDQKHTREDTETVRLSGRSFAGVVLARALTSRRMPHRIAHPRLLLLAGEVTVPIPAHDDLFACVCSLPSQLDPLFARLQRWRPDVVVVEKGMHPYLQDCIVHAGGMALLLHVGASALQRLALTTGADVVTDLPCVSVEELHRESVLGRCGMFHVTDENGRMPHLSVFEQLPYPLYATVVLCGPAPGVCAPYNAHPPAHMCRNSIHRACSSDTSGTPPFTCKDGSSSNVQDGSAEPVPCDAHLEWSTDGTCVSVPSVQHNCDDGDGTNAMFEPWAAVQSIVIPTLYDAVVTAYHLHLQQHLYLHLGLRRGVSAWPNRPVARDEQDTLHATTMHCNYDTLAQDITMNEGMRLDGAAVAHKTTVRDCIRLNVVRLDALGPCCAKQATNKVERGSLDAMSYGREGTCTSVSTGGACSGSADGRTPRLAWCNSTMYTRNNTAARNKPDHCDDTKSSSSSPHVKNKTSAKMASMHNGHATHGSRNSSGNGLSDSLPVFSGTGVVDSHTCTGAAAAEATAATRIVPGAHTAAAMTSTMRNELASCRVQHGMRCYPFYAPGDECLVNFLVSQSHARQVRLLFLHGHTRILVTARTVPCNDAILASSTTTTTTTRNSRAGRSKGCNGMAGDRQEELFGRTMCTYATRMKRHGVLFDKTHSSMASSFGGGAVLPVGDSKMWEQHLLDLTGLHGAPRCVLHCAHCAAGAANVCHTEVDTHREVDDEDHEPWLHRCSPHILNLSLGAFFELLIYVLPYTTHAPCRHVLGSDYRLSWTLCRLDAVHRELEFSLSPLPLYRVCAPSPYVRKDSPRGGHQSRDRKEAHTLVGAVTAVNSVRLGLSSCPVDMADQDTNSNSTSKGTAEQRNITSGDHTTAAQKTETQDVIHNIAVWERRDDKAEQPHHRTADACSDASTQETITTTTPPTLETKWFCVSALDSRVCLDEPTTLLALALRMTARNAGPVDGCSTVTAKTRTTSPHDTSEVAQCDEQQRHSDTDTHYPMSRTDSVSSDTRDWVAKGRRALEQLLCHDSSPRRQRVRLGPFDRMAHTEEHTPCIEVELLYPKSFAALRWLYHHPPPPPQPADTTIHATGMNEKNNCTTSHEAISSSARSASCARSTGVEVHDADDVSGTETDMIASLRRCGVYYADGGKTQATFYLTHDRRYLVKRIKTIEMRHWDEWAHGYFARMHAVYHAHSPHVHPPALSSPYSPLSSSAVEHASLHKNDTRDNAQAAAETAPRDAAAPTGEGCTLAKILAMFTVCVQPSTTTVRSTVSSLLLPGMSDVHHYILMEYIPQNPRDCVVYDLKGSQRDRRAGEQASVQLDGNLLHHLRRGDFFFCTEEDKARLRQAAHRDTAMLSDGSIMDYSLIAALNHSSKKIHVGMVDYLHPYNNAKIIESKVKMKLGSVFQAGAHSYPTIVDPILYRARFLHWVDAYFCAVPQRALPDSVLSTNDDHE